MQVPSCCVLTNLGLSQLAGSSAGGTHFCSAVQQLLADLQANAAACGFWGNSLRVQVKDGTTAAGVWIRRRHGCLCARVVNSSRSCMLCASHHVIAHAQAPCTLAVRRAARQAHSSSPRGRRQSRRPLPSRLRGSRQQTCWRQARLLRWAWWRLMAPCSCQPAWVAASASRHRMPRRMLRLEDRWTGSGGRACGHTSQSGRRTTSRACTSTQRCQARLKARRAPPLLPASPRRLLLPAGPPQQRQQQLPVAGRQQCPRLPAGGLRQQARLRALPALQPHQPPARQAEGRLGGCCRLCLRCEGRRRRLVLPATTALPTRQLWASGQRQLTRRQSAL